MQYARTTDPSTSHEAAASIKNATRAQASVLDVFHDAISGMTDATLVDAYELNGYFPEQSQSGIRTRRKELVDAGKIVDSGQRIKLNSGRRAIVWQLARSERMQSQHRHQTRLHI